MMEWNKMKLKNCYETELNGMKKYEMDLGGWRYKIQSNGFPGMEWR